MTERKYKYIAFISYRHIQPDFEIASEIHKAIENFKVPKELNPDGKYNEMRVFRDREELTTKDLSDSLDEALRDSEYLIIVCSKRTPLSPWCTREVREFKKYHDDSKIIPILIEGEPHDSFNEELQNLKSIAVDDKGIEEIKELELLAADLRPEEVKKLDFVGYEELEASNKSKLDSLTKDSIKILKQSEIYRIMATILGVNYGDLKQRHKERRLKRIIASTIAAAVILLAFGISMTNLYFQAERAKQTATQQTSMMVLKSADTAISQGDRGFSLLVSKEAMKDINPKMENYNQLQANYTRILNDALLSPKYSTMHVIDADSKSPFYDISNKHGWLVSGGELNTANIWDISSGALIKKLEFYAPVRSIRLDKLDGSIYIATNDGKVFKVDDENFEWEEIYSSEAIIRQLGESKDGKYLMLVKGLREIEILDKDNFDVKGKIVLDNYEEQFRSVHSLIGDNKYIVSDSRGRIMIYDITENRYVEVIESVEEKTYRYDDLSLDSKIYAYTDNGTIYLFNTHTGEKRQITDSTNAVREIKISPDSKKIFGISGDSVNAWNLEDLSFFGAYNCPDYVEKMVISQDGNKLIVSIRKDHKIGVFEDINKASLLGFEYVESMGSSHEDVVINLKTTEDGKFIISSSADSTIRIISMESTLSRRNIKGKIKAISQDNNLILIIDEEGNIKTYDFKTDEVSEMGKIGDSSYNNILNKYAISNDGNYIAISELITNNASVMSNDGVFKYETKAHESVDIFSVIEEMKISDSDNLLYTLGIKGEVFVTDLVSGELLKTLKDKEELGRYFMLSEDGSIIGIVYYNGEISLINTETEEVISRIEGDIYKIYGEEGKINRVFGQLGKRLFEYKNGKMEFYASNDERKGIATDRGNKDFVSNDGKYLITSVTGNNTIVTDLETGYRVRTLIKDEDLLFSYGVMNGDNNKIAYEFSEDTIVVTDFYSIEELEKMTMEKSEGRILTNDERARIGLISRVVEDEK